MLREDLEKHKNIKLDIEKFFGKTNDGFFEALQTFDAGHAKVYQYIKSLHGRLPIQHEESKKEIRNRKYSDPKYDNEEYM